MCCRHRQAEEALETLAVDAPEHKTWYMTMSLADGSVSTPQSRRPSRATAGAAGKEPSPATAPLRLESVGQYQTMLGDAALLADWDRRLARTKIRLSVMSDQFDAAVLSSGNGASEFE